MRTSLVFLAVLLFFMLQACQNEKAFDRDYPQIKTLEADHITEEGARFNAMIISGYDEVISEYGFVWGLSQSLSIDNSEKIVINYAPSEESFSCDITFALQPMKEYYVRSYIKSGNLTIYGNIEKFLSLGSQAPEIYDFEPKLATWGDTVRIYGRNFSFQGSSILVFFGENNSQVIESSDAYIITKVPDYVADIRSNLGVQILGNRSIADTIFTLETFGSLTSVFPKTATWGDTLYLNGVFPYNNHFISVSINGNPIDIVDMKESNLKIIFPAIDYVDSVKIQLGVDHHLINSNTYVRMIKPGISSIIQSQFGWQDTIVINGLFYPSVEENQVFFNNTAALILSADREHLTCVVPIVDNHNCQMVVRTGGYSITYTHTIDLMGPVIHKITPSTTVGNGIITIDGRYFNPGNTLIQINDIYFTSISSITGSKIIATLQGPYESGPVGLKISVLSKFKFYPDLLTIANPVVYSVSPLNCFYGDVVTISGDNFNPDNTVVRACDFNLEIVSITNTAIKIRLPFDLSCPPKLYVESDGLTIGVPTDITIIPPLITDMNPDIGKPGDIIHLVGDNFNPEYIYNKINFVNQNNAYVAFGEIVSGDKNNLFVKVPSMTTGDYSIALSSGATGASGGTFQCNSPWSAFTNMYYSQIYQSSIIDNNNMYLIGGHNADFIGNYQRFNFAANQNEMFAYSFSNLRDFFNGISFAINNKGYYGIGNNYSTAVYDNSFYEFDLTSNTWSQLNDFPGSQRSGSFCFSVGDFGYIGGGNKDGNLLSDFWKYDPSDDSWTKMNDFPGGVSFGATAVIHQDKAFVIDEKEVWLYNPDTDSWITKAGFPGNARMRGVAINAENGFYYGTGASHYTFSFEKMIYYQDIWFYSAQTNTWKRITDFPYGPRTSVYGYGYNNKVYIGGGIGLYNDNSERVFYDLYEYDPSFE